MALHLIVIALFPFCLSIHKDLRLKEPVCAPGLKRCHNHWRLLVLYLIYLITKLPKNYRQIFIKVGVAGVLAILVYHSDFVKLFLASQKFFCVMREV
jgi:hypothetical protein